MDKMMDPSRLEPRYASDAGHGAGDGIDASR